MKKESVTTASDGSKQGDKRKAAPAGLVVRSGIRAGALTVYAALTLNGTSLSSS